MLADFLNNLDVRYEALKEIVFYNFDHYTLIWAIMGVMFVAGAVTISWFIRDNRRFEARARELEGKWSEEEKENDDHPV